MLRNSLIAPKADSYGLAPGLPPIDQQRQSDLEMKKITDKAALVFKKTLRRELKKLEKVAS